MVPSLSSAGRFARDPGLVGKQDLATRLRGLKDREADFHGRKSPCAAMERLARGEDRIAELVEHGAARLDRWRRGVKPCCFVAIDHHALRQGPQIRALARGDHHAEMRMET